MSSARPRRTRKPIEVSETTKEVVTLGLRSLVQERILEDVFVSSSSKSPLSLYSQGRLLKIFLGQEEALAEPDYHDLSENTQLSPNGQLCSDQVCATSLSFFKSFNLSQTSIQGGRS